LTFIGQELREADEIDPAESVERVIAFSGGSPTEFLGESLIALEVLLGGPASLAPSLREFVHRAQRRALALQSISGFRSGTVPAVPGVKLPEAWSLNHPVLYTLLWVGIILAIFIPLSVRQYLRAAS
jgi:hypothetical protein